MKYRFGREAIISMIKVSLILTTLNCKDNLKRTLDSIEQQDYPNVEVVIKDGISTDGTDAVISDYVQTSKYEVVIIAKKDLGLYDAMNQGYRYSSGDIIAFFNDLFLDKSAISIIVAAVQRAGEGLTGAHADLVYATDEKVIRYWKNGNGKIKHGWMPGHPTLYLRREVYEKYGLYDINYKCSADYEFMIRILKDDIVKLEYIPKTLVRMYYGGTSTKSSGAYMTSINEAHMALKKNKIKGAWWIVLLRTLRTVPQFIGKNNKFI